jgi:signal transduction histidine kinase
MRIAVRFLLAAAAIGGALLEVWAVRSGWPWTSAVPDLAAGWSLLAAAGLATRMADGCRALIGLSGACWFLATPQMVGGLAGHVAGLLGALWLGPLGTALLGAPNAVPARPLQRGVAAAAWLHALPAVAAIAWVTTAMGGVLTVASLIDARQLSARPLRLTLAVVGASLFAAGVLQMAAGRGSALDSLVAVSVAGCGIAATAVRPDRTPTGGAFTGLVVELGRAKDAMSLERRLASALGDPALRVMYQLAPGLPFVTASGLPATTSAPSRIVTVMGQSGQVIAALEHDRAALEDPQLRLAVLSVGRLAVRRILRAAEAAQQSVDLAESRRRLVEAEETAQLQFAVDVAEGPGRALARCLLALDDALAGTPPGMRADVAAARGACEAARQELARIGSSGSDWQVTRRDLATALLELAGSAGAEAEVSIGCQVDAGVASVMWFAASEAVANALKHAGPARIRLSAAAEDRLLRLTVSDDGVGGADPDGHGLRGLADRLTAHDGRLVVQGNEPGGTVVTAEIPLGDGDRAAESSLAEAAG